MRPIVRTHVIKVQEQVCNLSKSPKETPPFPKTSRWNFIETGHETIFIFNFSANWGHALSLKYAAPPTSTMVGHTCWQRPKSVKIITKYPTSTSSTTVSRDWPWPLIKLSKNIADCTCCSLCSEIETGILQVKVFGETDTRNGKTGVRDASRVVGLPVRTWRGCTRVDFDGWHGKISKSLFWFQVRTVHNILWICGIV